MDVIIFKLQFNFEWLFFWDGDSLFREVFYNLNIFGYFFFMLMLIMFMVAVAMVVLMFNMIMGFLFVFILFIFFVFLFLVYPIIEEKFKKLKRRSNFGLYVLSNFFIFPI